MGDGDGDVNKFIGSATAKIESLEKRADKWDTSIDKLKAFQAKASLLSFIAMLAASFIMNFIIKTLGWS